MNLIGVHDESSWAADSMPKFVCTDCHKEFTSRRKLSGHRIGKHVRKLGLKNLTIQTKDLSEAQKGYLAGFLDGEGGVQITRSTRPEREYTLAMHPVVYFTNTNRQAIDTIANWLDVRCVVCSRQRAGRSVCYVLHITGTRNIEQLLNCLRPYLIIKASRADVMLKYCASRLSHLRSGERRFTESEVTLYRTLIELNKRGGAQQRQHTDR